MTQRLSLRIDQAAHDVLIELAVADRRSIPEHAEVLLMKAIHQANRQQQRQRAVRVAERKDETIYVG